jgi:hypothetical protein
MASTPACLPGGYQHKTVCHGRGDYARDEDGDGFCEVHVNTIEGFWSLPPISFPGCPERWWGDEALKAETDAPQATLEQ